MNFFTQKLRNLISGPSSHQLQHHHPFDIVKARKGIIRELRLSMEAGSLIGLFSPVLSDGMLLVTVLRIESKGTQEMAILAKYDIAGSLLSRSAIAINEITGICPFVKERRPTLMTP